MHTLVVVLSLAGPHSAGAESRCSLADLQLLAAQMAWAELLEHVEDIPPGERSALWYDLIEQGALGLVTATSHTNGPSAAMSKAAALNLRHPSLSRSTSFVSLRAAVGLRALEACLESERRLDDECHEELLAYVEGDAALALAAGRLIARHRFAHAALSLPSPHPHVTEAQSVAATCFEAMRGELVDRLGTDEPYRTNTCPLLRERGALSGLRAKLCRG